MSKILQGAYDFHIHTSPDVVQRKCTDLELARRLEAAGMDVLSSAITETLPPGPRCCGSNSPSWTSQAVWC